MRNHRSRPVTVRTATGDLKCQVRGCKIVLRGATGFQELERLIGHFRRAHLSNITLREALEIRAQWESKGDQEGISP